MRRQRLLYAAGAVLLFALATSCAGAASTATPAPTPVRATDVFVSANTSTYDIAGSTAEALRAQLDALGSGGHDAYTSWYVNWTVPHVSTDAGCAPGDVKVSVLVVYQMPRWEAPPDAPDALAKQWRAYMDALQHHEDGHRDIGVAAGRDVQLTLDGLAAYPTCDALQLAADAAAERVLDRYRQQEVEYDRTTDHGATQGARFP